MATLGWQNERLLINNKTRDKNYNDETPSLFSHTLYEAEDNERHMSRFLSKKKRTHAHRLGRELSGTTHTV